MLPALEQSLEEIIHRHEALRTNFITVDGQATQIIQTATNWTVSVVDLQHLSTTEQEIASQQLVQQQAIQPFDLATEALIRATLVVLSEYRTPVISVYAPCCLRWLVNRCVCPGVTSAVQCLFSRSAFWA